MVFIRVKKVKGFDYYYLVKSQWDSKRKISIQHTIKYLGKASDVTIDSIPLEYKNNPRILSLLASVTQEHGKKVVATAELKKKVFDLENLIYLWLQFWPLHSLLHQVRFLV